MVMSERKARGVLNLSDGQMVVEMFAAVIGLHRDRGWGGEIRKFLNKSWIENFPSITG